MSGEFMFRLLALGKKQQKRNTKRTDHGNINALFILFFFFFPPNVSTGMACISWEYRHVEKKRFEL